ncbi:ribonuclease P protein component [Candidatus Nomurabacteria bacterium]|nr:ribonuclease P protein component [Candidatus Nomurabacteria bacterium]
MIPKENRLKHMKDFQILFDEGRFIGDQCITLKVWKIDPEKYPRRAYTRDTLLIGFVVSVKVSKKAVERNRKKRQMREVVRLMLKKDILQSGYLIAVMAKKEILESDYAAIEKSIKSALSRARVLR